MKYIYTLKVLRILLKYMVILRLTSGSVLKGQYSIAGEQPSITVPHKYSSHCTVYQALENVIKCCYCNNHFKK